MNIKDTKPALFYKPDTSIWTDPYIQKNLLEAHLNPQSDAASRNPQSIATTVNFIDGQIQANSHILDLGCGPGLYAQRLTEKGHRVTGVDFNKASIAYAKKQATASHFICADYIRDFPDGQYDAVMMIYCDMGTHSDEQRDALLTACFEALNTKGKLIFDVFNENIVSDKKEEKTWQYSAGPGFWRKEPHLVLKQTFHYPQNRAFADQYHIVSGDKVDYFLLWERYYTKHEIHGLLKRIGFQQVSIFDDLLSGNNFTSNHEMFVVAQK